MKVNNLKNIANIIDYIEETLQKEPIHNIPLFNKRMEEKYGFKNYDRKIESNVESMDLYKDKTMFTDAPEVENVAIWIILERKTHLTENGNVDINELDMLMLKNRIDSWKKMLDF